MENIEEKIVELVDCIRRIPTGDNTQHWRYALNGNTLSILHRHELASHVFYDHGYASLISLGCIVEAISIASLQYGLKYKIEYQLEDLSKDIWAKVVFSLESEANRKPTSDRLFKAISDRETNRKLYKKKDFDFSLVERVNRSFEEYGVSIRVIDAISTDFDDYIHQCEQYIWHNDIAFYDTLKWIRFNKKEQMESKTGFNLKNIRLTKFDGFMISILKRSPLLKKILWFLILKYKVKLDTYLLVKNTPFYVNVAVKTADPMNLMHAGRAMYLFWLEITCEGFAAQPMTISSLLPFTLKLKGSLRGANTHFQEVFADGYKIVCKNFNIENAMPFWTLRFGHSKPLAQDERTERLNLDDYIVKEGE